MFTDTLQKIRIHQFSPFVILAITWQLVVTLVASVVSHSFEPATPTAGSKYMFDYMTNWDGQWYLSIINGSYVDPSSFSPAFFPLFPFVVWLLETLTFGLIDTTILTLALNTILLSISLFFLSKISVHFLPAVNKWILPIIFLLSPVAIFQNFFYTEALFCALAFSSYYFALKQKWSVMAILLILVTATRLPGILVIGLCGLEYLRFHKWSIMSSITDRKLLWFIITPLGALAYSLYLHIYRGDALAMFHSQKLWSYHQFNPNIFETYYRSLQTIVENLIHPNEIGYVLVVSQLLPLSSVLIAYVASIYLLVRRINIPLGIYGLVAAIFFSLNSNVVSVHRYMLAILTIHIALLYVYQSDRPSAKPIFFVCIYVSTIVQSILLFLFANSYFAG